jgi:N-acylglucosamine 2-epimerase
MVLLCCAQTLRRCRPDKADYYSNVSATIADIMIRFHMNSELRCVLETVSSDGSFIDNPAGRTVNPGHACENAWFLLNETLVSENQELRESALTILLWSLEKGWDKEYGGILYFADAKNRPCEQLEWDMKLWWVHNEALIATLMAYNMTHDPVYWEWFEKIHNYAFSHFADLEHGEWYGYLHRDGTVSHTQKGSMWKGPFHLPRCLIICEEVLGNIASDQEMNPVL